MIEIFSGAGLVNRRLALGIGVFDGVHRGHQLLLTSLCELAAAEGAAPVALTFDPHPRAVLRPQSPPVLLIGLAERIRLLTEYGAEAVLTARFTPEFAALAPEEFLDRLLAAPAEIAGICVGKHWRFGAGGAGDTALLAARCAAAGQRFATVSELCLDGEIVSSSNIRRAISGGRLATAAAMLGRPYRLTGTVEAGFGAANRELHYPTANLRLEAGVLPPDGVYAARAILPDGSELPAAVNVGLSPTFQWEGGERRLEVHLLDFAGDLYGGELGVELLDYLRPERAFGGAKELREQIGRDIVRIKQKINKNIK